MSAGDRPGPTPLRGALALALLAGAVTAGGTGLARYLAWNDHRHAALDAVASDADAIAAETLRSGSGAAAAAHPSFGSFAAISIVRPGATDDFGIARGAAVELDLVRDDRLRPADPAAGRRALLDLSARVEAAGATASPEGRASLFDAGGENFASAWSPILEDGRYAGLARVTVPVGRAADPVRPGLPIAAVALAAALLGVLLRLRPDAPSRAAAFAFGAFAGGAPLSAAGPALAAGTAAAAGLASSMLLLPTADLFRGLREQPRTYLYVLPAVVSLLVLVFVPFAMGVVLAFFDSRGNPVGLTNFVEVLVPSETSDTSFWATLGVTVLWTVSNVVLHVAIGLSLALVLDRPGLRFRAAYRVLLVLPWAVPSYITALVWKGMFGLHDGAVNAMLAAFGMEAVDWLGGSFGTAFLANLATNTWLGFPFMMVVSLGALQAIPKELYEAARIDGAGRLQSFRNVTLPLLKPALVPAIVLGSIWTFNMFNVIYLVSGGGPDGSTDILVTEAYRAFKVLRRFGLAAAYALVIFAVLYAYGKLTERITRASEGSYG